MKLRLATLVLGTLALAACGGTEDASTGAEVDTVEMTADEALAPVDEAPVADPMANTAPAPAAGADTGPAEQTEEEQIQQAGDDAAATAEAALDAMAEDGEPQN
ncbi:hypothetical protein [Qipengyuania sp.]|uniref:hypothetical protein n=1 Tax=Qipengyuania sp. TaxID=2004515 RepID=UPI0037365D57